MGFKEEFKDGIPYHCNRCGHNGKYGGNSKWYFTCGRCKTTISVKKAKEEARKKISV